MAEHFTRPYLAVWYLVQSLVLSHQQQLQDLPSILYPRAWNVLPVLFTKLFNFCPQFIIFLAPDSCVEAEATMFTLVLLEKCSELSVIQCSCPDYMVHLYNISQCITQCKNTNSISGSISLTNSGTPRFKRK